MLKKLPAVKLLRKNQPQANQSHASASRASRPHQPFGAAGWPRERAMPAPRRSALPVPACY
jgi:hypothetical protein